MGDFGTSAILGSLVSGVAGSLTNDLVGSATSGKGGGTVSGGVSPQQAALAEYEGQQRKLANDAKFSSGMGHSTGRTYANAAADINTAKDFAGISDTTANQQSQLQQLAQQSGLGQSTSGFGNIGSTGGSTDTGTTNTTPDVSTG